MPSGVYHSAARDNGGAVFVPSVGFPTDGSATYEPSVLGKEIDKFIEHSSIRQGGGLITQILAKTFDNQWEKDLIVGNIVFSVNIDNFHELDSAKSRVLSPSQTATLLVTGAQLCVLFEDACTAFYTNLGKTLEAIDPTFDTGPDAANKPFQIIASLEEKDWCDPDKILPDEAGDTEITRHAAVRRAYELQPSLGLCNSIYIKNHVFYCGVVESTQDSREPNCVLVAVAAGQGSQCLNYWGAFTKPFDHVGFVVTKRNDVAEYLNSPISDRVHNPFVLFPWRNPAAYAPGLPVTESGSKDHDDKHLSVGRTFTYLTYRDGNTLNEAIPHESPTILMRAGYVVAREMVDYANATPTGSDLAYLKRCFGLLGLRKGRADAIDGRECCKTVSPSVRLFVVIWNQCGESF